jgi:prepilin-type processing-associated H-X9-DG protein
MIAFGDSEILVAANRPPEETTGYFVAPNPVNQLIYMEVDSSLRISLDASSRAMVRRHARQWNMVFCDAHVEHGNVRTFFDWRNDEILKRWSRDNKAHRQ